MTKKTIQIKNRYTDEVIFEHECQNIKECVEEAVRSGANLWGANLSEANLVGANLSEADLSEADLNARFYMTKVTAKQKSEIVESDLFKVVDDSTSYSHSQELRRVKEEKPEKAKVDPGYNSPSPDTSNSSPKKMKGGKTK